MRSFALGLGMLAALGLAAAACFDDDDDGIERCIDPSRYPACTPDGEAYAECVDGRALVIDCDWDERCVQGQEGGQRWHVYPRRNRSFDFKQ